MAAPHTLRCFLVALAVAPLAGCSTEQKPPLLVIEDVRHWFEGNLLVVNITYANRGNITPGVPRGIDPLLEVRLMEWKKKDGEWGPGEELEQVGSATASLTFAAQAEMPWRKRYYDYSAIAYNNDSAFPGEKVSPGFVGPIEIPPGSRGQAEFAFLPTQHFRGNEGYYTIASRWFVHINVEGPEKGNRGWGSDYFTGCFNRAVPEFFGVHPQGPACYYYDRQGTTTYTGIRQEEGRSSG